MRIFKIGWKLSKYTIFYKFTPHRGECLGKRLRLAFEELGLTFIKIGQILSMRYDVLSREDCEALQELLDKVSPIPHEVILKIIETEYGRPWHSVFSTFDKQPLGSASVSQVHKAQIINGPIVAVKIKRPGVDTQWFDDIKVIKNLARLGAFFSSALRHIQIIELVQYFESWIKQDIDFILEVQNMKRVKEQYKFGTTKFRSDLGRGIFPAPFENFCTPNIIVMDYVDGIPMSRKAEILANQDYDIEKSIKTYINMAIRNWLRDDITTYIFQADPHLSNILALPHGDAANIDCGLISELASEEAAQCRDLVIAVYMKDIDKVVRIATEMTGVDYAKYALMLKPDLERYLQKTENEGIGFWFLEFAKIMVKHKIKFPLFLTTFGRTNIVLDGLASTYMPGQTALDIVGGELRRQAIKETIENVFSADWLGLAYTIGNKIRKSPKLLSKLIDNYFEDPLQAIRDFRDAISV